VAQKRCASDRNHSLTIISDKPEHAYRRNGARKTAKTLKPSAVSRFAPATLIEIAIVLTLSRSSTVWVEVIFHRRCPEELLWLFDKKNWPLSRPALRRRRFRQGVRHRMRGM
jgi:hypothetical protein